MTGASTGIGRLLAGDLADRGFDLVLASRSAERLESLAAKLEEKNVRAISVPTDVSSAEDRERLVDSAITQFGRIDVLINNAGVEVFQDFHTLDAERISHAIEVNLTGAIMLTRLVVPHMLERESGSIINMASTAGKHGPAYGAVYAATKAGLIGFTQSLRSEYNRLGIRVTAVCPGFTEGAGIYTRLKPRVGDSRPWLMGWTTTDQVCRAVIKAIASGPPELIVNRPPLRPIMVLTEMFPSFGEILVRFGTKRFMRKFSQDGASET